MITRKAPLENLTQQQRIHRTTLHDNKGSTGHDKGSSETRVVLTFEVSVVLFLALDRAKQVNNVGPETIGLITAVKHTPLFVFVCVSVFV